MLFVSNVCLWIFILGFLTMLVARLIWGPGWFFAWTTGEKVIIIGTLCLALVTGIVTRTRIDAAAETVWAENARHWQYMPLAVRGSADMHTFAPQLEHAQDMWNNQVGCPLFVTAAASPVENVQPDVRVIFLAGAACASELAILDVLASAGTYYCPDGTADIEVNRLDDVRVAYRLFAHELGHVLGLGHDPVGLMAPSITTASLEEEAVPSAKDREALAARYCAAAAR
jgi:hypothetical protein